MIPHDKRVKEAVPISSGQPATKGHPQLVMVSTGQYPDLIVQNRIDDSMFFMNASWPPLVTVRALTSLVVQFREIGRVELP